MVALSLPPPSSSRLSISSIPFCATSQLHHLALPYRHMHPSHRLLCVWRADEATRLCPECVFLMSFVPSAHEGKGPNSSFRRSSAAADEDFLGARDEYAAVFLMCEKSVETNGDSSPRFLWPVPSRLPHTNTTTHQRYAHLQHSRVLSCFFHSEKARTNDGADQLVPAECASFAAEDAVYVNTSYLDNNLPTYNKFIKPGGSASVTGRDDSPSPSSHKPFSSSVVV
ncbi:hypothetical protein C8R45DRAFT_1106837 [Mycena sanguinolenta]|nr:hypothetical protein C8R45DRAFT_1106837 [Mycena sanguinolenta]